MWNPLRGTAQLNGGVVNYLDESLGLRGSVYQERWVLLVFLTESLKHLIKYPDTLLHCDPLPLFNHSPAEGAPPRSALNYLQVFSVFLKAVITSTFATPTLLQSSVTLTNKYPGWTLLNRAVWVRARVRRYQCRWRWCTNTSTPTDTIPTSNTSIDRTATTTTEDSLLRWMTASPQDYLDYRPISIVNK